MLNWAQRECKWASAGLLPLLRIACDALQKEVRRGRRAVQSPRRNDFSPLSSQGDWSSIPVASSRPLLGSWVQASPRAAVRCGSLPIRTVSATSRCICTTPSPTCSVTARSSDGSTSLGSYFRSSSAWTLSISASSLASRGSAALAAGTSFTPASRSAASLHLEFHCFSSPAFCDCGMQPERNRARQVSTAADERDATARCVSMAFPLTRRDPFVPSFVPLDRSIPRPPAYFLSPVYNPLCRRGGL